MKRSFAGLAALTGLAILGVSTASAQDFEGWSLYGGALGGVGGFTPNDPGGIQPNLELRAPPLGHDWWMDVRPTVGATVATEGDQVNKAWAGLTADLLEWGPLTLEGQLGIAIHDGDLDRGPDVDIPLGCRVLAHLGVAVDWRIGDNWSAELYADHMSNAGACDVNNGYETTGVRFGYHF